MPRWQGGQREVDGEVRKFARAPIRLRDGGITGLVRRKATTELDIWLGSAEGGLLAAFANGTTNDKPAVTAAIASLWSNGQTEGQICKLKRVRRQM